jgi:hypothetical protein
MKVTKTLDHTICHLIVDQHLVSKWERLQRKSLNKIFSEYFNIIAFRLTFESAKVLVHGRFGARRVMGNGWRFAVSTCTRYREEFDVYHTKYNVAIVLPVLPSFGVWNVPFLQTCFGSMQGCPARVSKLQLTHSFDMFG